MVLASVALRTVWIKQVRRLRRTTSCLKPNTLMLIALINLSAIGANLDATGRPTNHWGGEGCPTRVALRQIVDDAFAAAPAAEFLNNGYGPGAPGYSVALIRNGCGQFRYAVGMRDLEQGRAMSSRARHHIGSLTKMMTAAVILKLNALGGLGPDGLESSVDRFLTPEEVSKLSLGMDPGNPLCPASIIFRDRISGAFRPIQGTCPDFSRITLRQLLNGNHGLFDFLNEVDRNRNGLLDSDEYALGQLFDALGVPHLTLPEGTNTAFKLLSATGVLSYPEAVAGGTGLADFETSFGNTGYTLLGIIAERVTGLSYNRLLRRLVGAPLGIPIRSLAAPPEPEILISRPYLVTTGAELAGLPEDLFAAYPLTAIADNPAINTYGLDAFIVTNSGGGAGSVVTTPSGYGHFFEALINGTLLTEESQGLFEQGFVPVDELPGVFHGFGLFQFEDPDLGPGFAKSGRVSGSACQLLHFVEPGTTVVVCRSSVDAFLSGAAPPSSTPVGDLARQLVQAGSGS